MKRKVEGNKIIVTKSLEIIATRKFLNSSYEQLKQVRDKHHLKTNKTCFLCGKKFKPNDAVHIVFIKKHRNEICCENHQEFNMNKEKQNETEKI